MINFLDKKSNKKTKALVIILELLAFLIFLYLVISPFWGQIKYSFKKEENINWQNIEEIKKIVENTEDITTEEELTDASEEQKSSEEEKKVDIIKNNQDKAHNTQNKITTTVKKEYDSIIIPKIGVDAPIIQSDNFEYALSRGSWIDPIGSTPGNGGNTIITGHRFKYLPPNNLTFYLLDKIVVDDIISVTWQGRYFYYRVIETKIVPKTDTTILAQTREPILTIFTCDPIFSEKNRLVVVAKEIVEE